MDDDTIDAARPRKVATNYGGSRLLVVEGRAREKLPAQSLDYPVGIELDDAQMSIVDAAHKAFAKVHPEGLMKTRGKSKGPARAQKWVEFVVKHIEELDGSGFPLMPRTPRWESS